MARQITREVNKLDPRAGEVTTVQVEVGSTLIRRLVQNPSHRERALAANAAGGMAQIAAMMKVSEDALPEEETILARLNRRTKSLREE